MAFEGYINGTNGTKQGKFPGTSERAAHKDKIPFQRFESEVLGPRDVIDGKAKGRRVHKPWKVLIEMDKSVPYWLSSLTQNELIKESNFEFWHKNSEGADEQVFNVKLIDCHVVSARFFTGGVGDSSDLSSGATAKNASEFDTKEYFEFGLSYRSITWEHKVGKTQVTDDWYQGTAT